jgi:hypothetical protein
MRLEPVLAIGRQGRPINDQRESMHRQRGDDIGHMDSHAGGLNKADHPMKWTFAGSS